MKRTLRIIEPGILQPEELTAGSATFHFGNEMEGEGVVWLLLAWQFLP